MPYRIVFVIVGLMLGMSSLSAWWGFNQGVKYGGALESVALANISTAQVKRLKSGSQEELESVISLFEIYVDSGIDSYAWYSESGSKYIGELYYSGYKKYIDKSMRNLASYRAKNPEPNISHHLSEEAREEYLKAYSRRKTVVELVSAKES